MFAQSFQRMILPFRAAEMFRDVTADRTGTMNDVHVTRVPCAVKRRLDCLFHAHSLGTEIMLNTGEMSIQATLRFGIDAVRARV
jgi:hypothetical protein